MPGTTRWCRIIAAAISSLAWVAVAAPAAAAPPQACGTLGNGTQIGASTVLVAQSVPAGDYTDADRVKQKGLPAFCRIFAVASPHPSSRILIEIWMPTSEAWNGKLLGTGNGGSAGKIGSASLAGGLRRGYATANTDLGSYPAGQPGVGFNFGDGHPEMIRDWAYRATHEMTVLAKEVVARHYGRAAAKAYFVGCSTGGHQALTEAQKFPEDYDAIIAGAPAHNRTRLHTRFAALRLLGAAPGAALPPALMSSWRAAILKSCAGRDGGAAGDAFLTDPLRCTLAPRQLACEPGAKQDGCLSEAQVRALGNIYGGTRNPRTGELIYFGDVRGAEDQLMLVYGEGFFSPGFDLTNWILPPERTFATFDFDQDLARLDDTWASEVNAVDPDLGRFAARGGKLIMYHGWEDGLITPTDSIDYFQRIKADGRKRADFARLFMVPGLAHCFGGPGTSLFGQLSEVPSGSNPTPANDLLMALDRWAEEGVAPDTIVAQGLRLPAGSPPPNGETGRGSRPLCAFPAIARYDGKGDPLNAGSFRCRTAPVPKYERPAERYLR